MSRILSALSLLLGPVMADDLGGMEKVSDVSAKCADAKEPFGLLNMACDKLRQQKPKPLVWKGLDGRCYANDIDGHTCLDDRLMPIACIVDCPKPKPLTTRWIWIKYWKDLDPARFADTIEIGLRSDGVVVWR